MGGLGHFFSSIWHGISHVISETWKFISHKIIEPIMNFLGFEDEDIYEAQVVFCKVINEDLLNQTRISLHLKRSQHGTDLPEYALGYGATGNDQFNKYYNYGKWYYTNYLPDSIITAVTLNTNAIRNRLQQIYGSSATITEIYTQAVKNKDWALYQLQQMYDYDIGLNYCEIGNNQYYRYSSAGISSDNVHMDITLISITEVTVYTHISTTITITDIEDSVTHEIDPDYQLKTTVVTERSETLTREGLVIDTVPSHVVSNTSEQIPYGSETDSYDEDSTSEELTLPAVTRVITVPYKPANYCYTVEFTDSTGRDRIWIYDPSTNTYPELTHPVNQSSDYHMYPVVVLREGGVNIIDAWHTHKPTQTEIDAVNRSEPPELRETKMFQLYQRKKRIDNRLSSTEEILSAFNLNVTDLTNGYSNNPNIADVKHAFFFLGVQITNYKAIISRVLFEMFEYIYNTMPAGDTTSDYSVSFKENPFNAALTWKYDGVEEGTGRIGNVGTYTHGTATETFVTHSWKKLLKLKTVPDGRGRKLIMTHQLITEVLVYNTADWNRTDGIGEYTHTGTDENDESYEYTTISYPEKISYLANRGINPKRKTTEIKGTEISEKHEDWGDSRYSEAQLFDRYKDRTEDTWSVDKKTNCIALRKQVDTNTVKYIYISGLSGFHIIRAFNQTIGVTVKELDDKMVIPLSKTIVDRLTLMEKTALLGECTYLVFYSAQHQHIRWYQTRAFMGFLQAVSIVITVISFGMSLGSAMMLAEGAKAALMAVLKQVAIAVVVSVTLKLIASFVNDPFLKAVLSVGVMVAGMYAGGALDEIDFFTGTELCLLPGKAAEIFMGAQLEQEASAFQAESSSFSSAYEERMEEFDSISKSLEDAVSTGDLVDLMRKNQDSVARGSLMSPDQFFSIAITASFNLDILFDGFYNSSVYEFCDNKMKTQAEDVEED